MQVVPKVLLCSVHYTLCWTLQFVPKVPLCSVHYTLCWTLQFVPNVPLCSVHYTLCWTLQFVPNVWNLSRIFQFFIFIYVTFNGATGRVAMEAQLYGVGHRIAKEWGAGPCLQTQGRATSDVWQLRFCNSLSCVVFIWNVSYEWLQRVLGFRNNIKPLFDMHVLNTFVYVF
jgi:hypothetical protein